MSSPTGQMPTDELPMILDLVDERPLPKTSPTTGWTDGLYESRHNEDFRTRNQRKVLQIETWLSDFAMLLRSAARQEDQQAFVDLHKRLRIAAEGLLMHARRPSGDIARDAGGGSPARVVRDRDYWMVRHPAVADDVTIAGSEKDESLKDMTNKAREARARWQKMTNEREKRWEENGEQGYLDVFEDEDEKKEWDEVDVGSGETTLVDDEVDLKRRVAVVKLEN